MRSRIEALKEALASFSIDAAKVEIKKREDSHSAVACCGDDPHARPCDQIKGQSHIKSVPTLSIYVRTTENYRSLNIDDHDGNWSSRYSGTNAIRKMWKSLLGRQIKTDDYYDDDMLIFIYNNAKHGICNSVYQNREQVLKLVRNIGVKQPKEIFCCSRPGYNVIYADVQDYKTAETNGDFAIISSAILRLMQSKISEMDSQEVSDLLSIKFYHPEMPNFSWYGFARQD